LARHLASSRCRDNRVAGLWLGRPVLSPGIVLAGGKPSEFRKIQWEVVVGLVVDVVNHGWCGVDEKMDGGGERSRPARSAGASW
jgi:hypothetical protein